MEYRINYEANIDDANVIVTGISGGWSAKELSDPGRKAMLSIQRITRKGYVNPRNQDEAGYAVDGCEPDVHSRSELAVKYGLR